MKMLEKGGEKNLHQARLAAPLARGSKCRLQLIT